MRTVYGNPEVGGKKTRERIELVRIMSRAGMDEVKICARLDKYDFFPEDKTYKQKMEIVQADVRKVKKEDRERFDALREDSQSAWAEYVGRQMAIFEKCMDDGDHGLASQISKDIARAYGIDTNEPIKIEGDLISLMQAASKKAMERRNSNAIAAPRETIVDSRNIQDAVVIPASDNGDSPSGAS